MTAADSSETAPGAVDADLQDLANWFGILPGYDDVWGKRHEVTGETICALLHAMGIDCSDGEAVSAALEGLRARRRGRLLEPVLVIDEAGPVRVTINPAGLGPDDTVVHWRLTEENGHVHDGEHSLTEAEHLSTAFSLDLPLPPGYHDLHVSIGERRGSMALIVAPAHCYVPDALLGDARWWGLGVQLYGVRRAHDWGIGDFSALPPLLDICARHGAATLGVSPLHAMFPAHPESASPYSPSSRLFLNVLYIDLEAASEVTGSERARALLTAEDTTDHLQALNAQPLVRYPEVARAKLRILDVAFADFRAAPESLRHNEFRRYCEAEGDALLRHALFEALQEHFHALDPGVRGWQDWPSPYRDPASAAVGRFLSRYGHRVDFYRWLQWLADEQLAAAARHADDRELPLGLYLDLAVSVDPQGSETWFNQHVYALDASVGAPPDVVNVNGQNWGLPPLNPVSLYESGYALFIETLRRNMRYAGAIRIDHVMGLMRLFWIPRGCPPGVGAYVRYPVNDLLGIVALESQRNRCLVVGEDLGTIPDGLAEAMERLRILSYRLLYFEQTQPGSYLPPEQYPARALVAVSTHDLATLQGWWTTRDLDWREKLDLYPDERRRQDARQDRERDRQGLLKALHRSGLAPPDEVSGPALAIGVQRFLGRTRSMLQLVQLEDALGLEEQANLPGTVHDHPNWRRRMPVTLEALEAQALFRDTLAAVADERQTPGETVSRVLVPDPPRATYRLQLHRDFTFEDARALVDYLDALGISHAYTSPYLRSRTGSTHGYDIIDHNSLDPEIGSRSTRRDWLAALRARGMSHVLDIVPNHMGIMGDDNAWWLDVLEHGEAARHSHFFDIDWHPPERALAGKVLLPVLGEPYGDTLDGGDLQLVFDAADGRFVVRYFEHLFPLDPRVYPLVLDHRPAPFGSDEDALGSAEAEPTRILPERAGPVPESAELEFASISAAFGKLPRRTDTSRTAVAERYRDSELLRQRLLRLCHEVPPVAARIDARVAAINGSSAFHELLERQAWRLAHWRTASDEINYRRFFDINDLAGLSTQDPEVFEAIHQRVLDMVARGEVGGLRVDHPDGLYDPAGYFRRLRDRCAEVLPEGAPPVYLVVEKILGAGETLPADWAVSGTTGYEFARLANGLFVDPRGAAPLTRVYTRFIGGELDFDDLVYRCKHLVMGRLLAGELQVLGNRLHRIAQADPHTRDYTRNSLVEALREIVACFPVYRSYVRGPGVSEQDRRNIDRAVAAARRRSDIADASAFDFVRNVMLQRLSGSAGYLRAMEDFTMKLQQFTAPVTAKGVEDTAFYRYGRLLSLNDVGDEPSRFGVSVAEFHASNEARLRHWPASMLGTSSHDSKRGEDARARLDVVSEIPREWRERINLWRRWNRRHVKMLADGPAPSRNDEYFLYQTLVASWPVQALDQDLDEEALASYRDRIDEYLRKAVREAKARTSWIDSDAAYEGALADFIRGVLDPVRSAEFVADLGSFVRRLAPPGLYNGLGQTLLKLTSPGVPDIYQGSELWNFALVDPDNRRPVDYVQRRRLLARLGPAGAIVPAETLLGQLHAGLPKLYLIRQVLELRRRDPELFDRGAYLPLETRGAFGQHLCAYARQHRDRFVVVLVPRLLASLMGADGEAPLGSRWEDTQLLLPRDLLAGGSGAWLWNILTGERQPRRGTLAVADLLGKFPLAVLADRALDVVGQSRRRP